MLEKLGCDLVQGNIVTQQLGAELVPDFIHNYTINVNTKKCTGLA